MNVIESFMPLSKSTCTRFLVADLLSLKERQMLNRWSRKRVKFEEVHPIFFVKTQQDKKPRVVAHLSKLLVNDLGKVQPVKLSLSVISNQSRCLTVLLFAVLIV